MMTDDERRPGRDGYDPLLTPRMVWRGKWILLLSLIAAAGGGWAYLQYGAQNSYEAQSRLVVERERVSVQPDGVNGGEAVSLTTQVEVIRSPLILGPALRAAELTVPGLSSENQLVSHVLGSLTTEVVQNANVISIRYRSADPQEAARLVTAIVESYSAYVEQNSNKTRSEVQRALARREEALSQREVKLQDDLRQLYEQYQAVRTPSTRVAEGASSVRNGTRSVSGLANGTAKIGDWSEPARAAFASVDDRSAALNEPARSRKSERSPLMASAAPTQAESHPVRFLTEPGLGASDYRGRVLDQFLQAQMREAHLLKSRGPKHADVTAVREQIAVLNAMLEQTDEHVEAAALFANIQRIEAQWDTTFQQLREVQAANDVALAGQPKIAIQNLQGTEVPVHLAWPRPIPFLAICLVAGLFVGCGVITATDRLRRG